MPSLRLETPISLSVVRSLRLGDTFEICGKILCGRDAVLPKLVKMSAEGKLGALAKHLEGAVIFHTAVSPAGIGPTSSNKIEIESSICPLSAAGVRIHLGKGAIAPETVKCLSRTGSIFAVTPPASALLRDKIVSRSSWLFPRKAWKHCTRSK